MSKDIVKQIQVQFDELPRQINLYIINNFSSDQEFIKENTLKKLVNFHITTTNRWIKAEKKYNVSSVYALPNNIFKKIENENKNSFIEVWNSVLDFLWYERYHFHSEHKNACMNLYLLIRGHLIQDYGYFDTIDTNKLFRVTNNENIKTK